MAKTYKDVLLTSENYIKTTTSMDDNILGKALLPAIKLAQDIELQEAIGTALYRKLQTLIFDKEIEDDGNEIYAELLDDYIQPFLAYQTLANTVMMVGVKTANIGVVETNDTNIVNIAKAERDLQKESYLHFARHYLKQMQDWLKSNCKLIPELEVCSCTPGSNAHLNSAGNPPIWLGGTRAFKGYNDHRLSK